MPSLGAALDTATSPSRKDMLWTPPADAPHASGRMESHTGVNPGVAALEDSSLRGELNKAKAEAEVNKKLRNMLSLVQDHARQVFYEFHCTHFYKLCFILHCIRRTSNFRGSVTLLPLDRLHISSKSSPAATRVSEYMPRWALIN